MIAGATSSTIAHVNSALQAAAFKDGQPTNARRLEGRITRIAYRTNPGPSILEVSRNFETQLAKAGFETLLACDTDACGGIPFSESIDALPIPQMWVDGFNYHYFAGRKVDGGRSQTIEDEVSALGGSQRYEMLQQNRARDLCAGKNQDGARATRRQWQKASARPATSRSMASISIPTRRW